MQQIGVYQGTRELFKVDTPHPFAFGRNSALFKGTDNSGKVVCIKVFPVPDSADKGVREFMLELHAQMALKHPHILQILDFGEGTPTSPAPFLVYPFCEKGDLRKLMKTRNFIPLDEALPIIQQIALAIDFAHKSGFVHGDIKPENILFDQDFSHAYLSDFGMSRYFAITERVTSFETAEGGSSAYVSPEQIMYDKQSSSSDIYSFAVVVFELLTGQLPFDIGVSPFQQMKLKVEGKFIEPSDINPKISPSANVALTRALNVESSERPETAFDFCQMLLKSDNVQVKSKRTLRGFWGSLEPVNKVAIITAIIAALAGILTALLK